MKLKRLYSPSVVGQDSQPMVTGVKVIHTGLEAEQRWDRGQLMQFASEGWLKFDGSQVTIAAENATLVYDVVTQPGYFVRSTGERIPVSELAMQQFMTEREAPLAAAEARAFLAGKGLAANDYDATRAYTFRLRSDLHEHWRKVVDPLSGNDVAAHTLNSAEA